jgi:hypothetical protein
MEHTAEKRRLVPSKSWIRRHQHPDHHVKRTTQHFAVQNRAD